MNKPLETLYGVRLACHEIPDDGFSHDRFTVVFVDDPYSRSNPLLRSCVGLSGHSGAMRGRHLGPRITLSRLPVGLRRIVVRDCLEICKETLATKSLTKRTKSKTK